MAELPAGTVTFLFTDLEVSTRLWEREPEAMRTTLARHDRILRDAIEIHEGHVVKGTGDGVHDPARGALPGHRGDPVERGARARPGLDGLPIPVQDRRRRGSANSRGRHT